MFKTGRNSFPGIITTVRRVVAPVARWQALAER